MYEADGFDRLRQKAPDPDTIFWLLGEQYAPNRREARRRHTRTVFKCTYRNAFPAIEPYRITDDAGWGCMLRSAQMLMANTCIRQLLGKDWRRPDSIQEIRQSSLYCEIFRWFCDYPGYPCLYSIHHMIQSGMRYDKLPEEWYGPGTAALVLRDLAHCHRRKYGGKMEVYVAQGRTLYVTEMQQLCRRQKRAPPTGDNGEGELKDGFDDDAPASPPPASPLSPRSPKGAGGVMYDPLFNPPPPSANPFECGLLILIPLRLGLRAVNAEYLPGLRWSLRSPYGMGILGGRPNHAIYFVGYQGTTLYGHDPHTVVPNPPLGDPFPSEEYANQVSSNELVPMPVSQLDPSVALAFYVRDEAQFEDFIRLAKDPEQDLFVIEHHPPSYDGLGSNDQFFMDEVGPSTEVEDDEDYIFV